VEAKEDVRGEEMTEGGEDGILRVGTQGGDQAIMFDSREMKEAKYVRTLTLKDACAAHSE